jgi:hypothetical protein
MYTDSFVQQRGMLHGLLKRKPISFYGGSFSSVFYACESLFYDVFFFYHKAYPSLFLFNNNFLKMYISIAIYLIEAA